MYIDFKITAWERMKLPDTISKKEINKIKDLIKHNKLTSYILINDFNCDNGVDILIGTNNPMDISDNDFDSTIELYINNELITANGNV